MGKAVLITAFPISNQHFFLTSSNSDRAAFSDNQFFIRFLNLTGNRSHLAVGNRFAVNRDDRHDFSRGAAQEGFIRTQRKIQRKGFFENRQPCLGRDFVHNPGPGCR